MCSERFMKRSFFLTVPYCLFFCGCVIDPIPFYSPEKLEGQPNTFKIPDRLFFLYSKADKDIIQSVSVEHRAETEVWEIKAVCNIPVPSFQVTVGEIPKGFEQVNPEPPEKFVPVEGERYIIYIHTKFSENPEYSPHIGPYGWTADPLKSK